MSKTNNFISFQGSPGAYSDMACRSTYPGMKTLGCKTFSDTFFEMAKDGFIYKKKKTYKVFISIKKFNQIVFILIKKNSSGIFNVSLGKKIYINQIITWLNIYNSMKINIINPKSSFNNDNFTLNNKKLMNKIKIKNNVIDLKNECLQISKSFFKKK